MAHAHLENFVVFVLFVMSLLPVLCHIRKRGSSEQSRSGYINAGLFFFFGGENSSVICFLG